MWSMHPRRAFTLVEIIVVITIISILSGIIYVALGQGSAVSRDADRQADLRRLQAAIEEYKRANGVYPTGCRGADNWSGEPGTAFACAGGSAQYITGDLVPTFIDRLPFDPRRGECPAVGPCERGYAYITNAARDVYKLIAMNTVESEVVTYAHPLKSCDVTGSNNNNIAISGLCRFICSEPSCGTGGATPRVDAFTNLSSYCNYADPDLEPTSDMRFERSYAVWGGFAPLAATTQNSIQCDRGVCVDETSPFNEALFIPSPATLTAGEISRLRMRAVYPTTNIICR